MRYYYNDSTQVKKCLNYEEFSAEKEKNLDFNCCCVHNHNNCNNSKLNDRSKPLKWFDNDEKYTTRYKLDYKVPLISSSAHLNKDRTEQEVYNFKRTTSNLKDMVLKRPNVSNTHSETQILKNDLPTKKIRIKKRDHKSKIRKSTTLNTTLPIDKEKKVFKNLKDHFAAPVLTTQQNSKKVQINCKEEPVKRKIPKNNELLQAVSPCSSLFSSDVDKEQNSYLLKNQVNYKTNLSNSLSLKQDERLKIENKVNKAYFVEPLNSLNESGSVMPTKNRNICKHISLVCDKCVNNFDKEKNKLFQFDLANFNRK